MNDELEVELELDDKLEMPLLPTQQFHPNYNKQWVFYILYFALDSDAIQ